MHFNLDHWSSVRDHTERKEVCRIMCGREAHWACGQKTHPHLDINILPAIVRVTMPLYFASNEA